VTLSTFAAAAPLLLATQRPQLSIDLSCPNGTALSSKPADARRSCSRMAERTDGRTLDHSVDPPPHSVRALSESIALK